MNMIMAISLGPLHRRCGRCGELGTAEQVRAPLRHSRTLRSETHSEPRSLLERGAGTSAMHLQTKFDVISSFSSCGSGAKGVLSRPAQDAELELRLLVTSQLVALAEKGGDSNAICVPNACRWES